MLNGDERDMSTTARQLDGILVRRTAKAPGHASYFMHELEFSTEVPVDQQTEQRLTALLGKWEPFFTTFEAKYAKSQAASHKPAPTTQNFPPFDPADYDIDWQTNQFGEGDYARSDWPNCQDLLNHLKKAGKPLQFGDYTYSLHKEYTYIYRKKTTPNTQ